MYIHTYIHAYTNAAVQKTIKLLVAVSFHPFVCPVRQSVACLVYVELAFFHKVYISSRMDTRQLFVNGFTKTQTLDEVRSLCQSYGTFFKLIRPEGKTFVFLMYETAEQAAEAKAKFDTAGVKCGYKHHRENGHTPSPDSPQVIQRSKQLEASHAALKEGESLLITHVHDYHVYAVQAKKRKEHAVFMNFMSQCGMDADDLAFPAERHTWALALHQSKYTRAILLAPVRGTEDYVPIYLLDIGAHKDVTPEQLKVLHSPFNETRWVHRLRLHNVARRETTTGDAVKYLESLVGKEVELKSIHRCAQSVAQVELFDPATLRRINKTFNWLNCEFKVSSHLTIKLPILGQSRLLHIVDDSLLKKRENLLTFIDDKDMADFQAQRMQIQNHGKSAIFVAAYAAAKDDLCVVKINAEWLRCAFIATVADKAKVYLIDYFRTEYVNAQSIQKIDRKSAELPILTFAGQFHGYDQVVGEPQIFQLLEIVEQSRQIAANTICKLNTSDCVYTVQV